MTDHPEGRGYGDTVTRLGRDIFNIYIDEDRIVGDHEETTSRDHPGSEHTRQSADAGATETDFKLFGFRFGETAEPPKAPVDPVVSLTSDIYDMNHRKRGYALIFNNEHFSYDLRRIGFSNRSGSMVDEQSLKKQLRKLGFQVKCHLDLTAEGMMRECKWIASLDHSDNDCFVCIILTHGEEGIVYGKNKAVEIKDLTKPFRGDHCPSLAGKPKLFILQACRGQQTDPGVEVNVSDAQGYAPDDVDAMIHRKPDMIRLPVDADFLFAYSTVAGFYSWRNNARGSWFIQCFCELLEKYGTEIEFVKLLTLVNRKVAQNYSSYNPNNPDFHEMKQVPCITSMLTKDVFFPKK